MSTEHTLTVLRRHGIVNPTLCVQMCDKHKLPVSIGAAILLMESGGGRNVFGHDPTSSIPVRWRGTQVTKLKYRYYKLRRPHQGMQGVGPVQLTWYEKQDRADALGGCHLPQHSISVGFHDLAAAIAAHGKHDGIRAYNGSGPAAESYARRCIAIADTIHKDLTT